MLHFLNILDIQRTLRCNNEYDKEVLVTQENARDHLARQQHGNAITLMIFHIYHIVVRTV